MTSEKYVKNISFMEEKGMENVALHRAESMVNEQIEMPETIKDNHIQDKSKSQPSQSIGSILKSIATEIPQMKIEVVMFLYMFPYTLRSISSTSMIMDKVCLVHLEYSEEICTNLSSYKTIKSEVEKLANNYHLGHTLIQLTPSAFLALFIGAWSDKYSRKIPIIIALLGIILDGFGATLCAYYMNSRVEYYLIGAMFTGLSGGFISALTVLYSYVSDVTTSDKRTMKYALMEMAFGLAIPLGSLGGGYIYEFSGYVSVFLTSTCGHIIGLFWVILMVEETRGLDCNETLWAKFRKFWNTDSLIGSFKATMKKRPNRGREQILWLIAAMCIAFFNFSSTTSITYFYVHHQYDWDNPTYSTVYAEFAVFSIIVMLIVVPISKKKNIGDPILGIAGSISSLMKNIGTGIASKPWIYYVANFVGLFSTLATLAGRARISKVTSKEDLGKVFAFVTTAESILPIAGTAIVSQVLNATLDSFPGLVYEVMAVLLVIPLGVFIWLYRLPAVNYEEMNDDLQEERVNQLISEKVLHLPHNKSHTKK